MTTAMGFVRLAKAKQIEQVGFDESKIDGRSTLNLWALVPAEVEGEPPGKLSLSLSLSVPFSLTFVCVAPFCLYC